MSEPKPVQMGGEPLTPDPTRPPPRPHLPEGREHGLTPMKPYMDEGAWETFITVVTWAIHWQNINDKQVPRLDPSTLGFMMSPFIGMGNPNVWPIYQRLVSTLVMSTTMRWFEKGEEYRNSNSLAWAVIEALAPDLAQVSLGYSARSTINDILSAKNDLEVTFR